MESQRKAMLEDARVIGATRGYQFHGWRAAAGFVLDGGPARQILESSAAGMNIANHAVNADFRQGEEALIRLCLEGMAAIARQDGQEG